MAMSSRWFKIQGVIHLLVAVSAYPGGLAMIIRPDGSLMGVEGIVDRIPFDSLLIPGILLFTVNGIGQTLAGIYSLRKHWLSPYLSAIFGLGLITWILVESLMLQKVVFLSILYFAIGVLQTAIAVQLHAVVAKAG